MTKQLPKVGYLRTSDPKVIELCEKTYKGNRAGAYMMLRGKAVKVDEIKFDATTGYCQFKFRQVKLTPLSNLRS